MQASKPNKTWRVLHRVTYVERPALMGFGQELRKRLGEEDRPWWYPSIGGVLQRVEALQEKNTELEAKLDEVLELLRKRR